MARRGGVKRIASEIYPTTRYIIIAISYREVIINFLTSLVKDAVIYTEHAQRTTV